MTGGAGAGGTSTSIGGVPSGGPNGGFGCQFGGCGGMGSGFVPGIDVIDAIDTPWVFRVISWGWPYIEAGLATVGTTAAAAGALVPLLLMQKGDAVPHIHQAGREQVYLDHIARAFCVDRNALRDAIHRAKKNLPKGMDLTEDEIEEIARSLPKIPGCVPTRF